MADERDNYRRLWPASVGVKRAIGDPPKSWWCDKCSQEVYSLRCKYCGKSEEEKE